MNFEAIKQDWKTLQAGKGMKYPVMEETLLTKIERLQAKIIFQNLLVSIAFGLTFMVLGWGFSHFRNHNEMVAGSIIGMGILLILTMFIFWKRVLFWRNRDFGAATIRFIDIALRKLRFNLQVTRIFMPLYGLFLTTMVVLYEWGVLTGLSMQSKRLIIGGTIMFNLLVFTIGIYRRRRKDEQQIVPLMEELLSIRSTLTDTTS